MTTQELLSQRTEAQRDLDVATQVARDFLAVNASQPLLFISGRDGVRGMNPPAVQLSDLLGKLNPALRNTVLNNMFTSSSIGCGREVRITDSPKNGDSFVMLEPSVSPKV